MIELKKKISKEEIIESIEIYQYLKEKDFVDVDNLGFLKFSDCDIQDMSLLNLNIIDLHFYNCNLKNVTFDNSNLYSIDFEHSNLENVDFINTNLCNSCFNKTDIKNTNFEKVELSSSYFSESKFKNVSFLNSNLGNTFLYFIETKFCKENFKVNFENITFKKLYFYDDEENIHIIRGVK